MKRGDRIMKKRGYPTDPIPIPTLATVVSAPDSYGLMEVQLGNSEIWYTNADYWKLLGGGIPIPRGDMGREVRDARPLQHDGE